MNIIEKETQKVWVLIHRGRDFANCYVGRSEVAACEKFCKETLFPTLSHEMEQMELPEDERDDYFPDEIERCARHLLDGKWESAVNVYREYVSCDSEKITVYEEEVQS